MEARAAIEGAACEMEVAEKKYGNSQNVVYELKEKVRESEVGGPLEEREETKALMSSHDYLSKLSKADVGEIRMMKTPPAGVVMTMKALCIIFETKPVKVAAPDGMGKIDDYWEAAKKELLCDPRLLDRVVRFDEFNFEDAATAIPVMVGKLRPIIDDPEFDPDRIKKGSIAAGYLSKWAKALIAYLEVGGPTRAPRADLSMAQANLQSAMNVKNEKAEEKRRNEVVLHQLLKEKTDLELALSSKEGQ